MIRSASLLNEPQHKDRQYRRHLGRRCNVGELLGEIMTATGTQAFNFDLDETQSRLRDLPRRDKYSAFITRTDTVEPVGFVALYECHALYAEGPFGTIAEVYVRDGERLPDQTWSFKRARRWKRLEVTTPRLPQFDRTPKFYERAGFAVTGGRKPKAILRRTG